MFIVHTVSEVTDLLQANAHFKQTLPEAETEYNAICQLQSEVQRFAQVREGWRGRRLFIMTALSK